MVWDKTQGSLGPSIHGQNGGKAAAAEVACCSACEVNVQGST